MKCTFFLKILKNSFLLCFLLFTISSYSQGVNVKGQITSTNGVPIPGVNIVQKGTSNGVISDFDGNYQITLTGDSKILVISYVGFKSKEVVAEGNTPVNVKLDEDALAMDEVVVVGYGKQKRASVTGAVSTINSEIITVAPAANVTNTLAGRLPGLITKQQGGIPGSDNASLSIRGFGAPLVMIDGIEGNISNIDANEIETVTLLKDASAAIYGARAGNGVILITTKRGKEGKVSINLNTTTTFQRPTNLVKMASSGQMAELTREAHTNSGQPEETQTFTEEEVALFYAGTNPDYPNTNWWDVVSRDSAPLNQYNLSVNVGTDKIKYYGFLGYTTEETLFKKNGGEFKRYNLRSNVDAQVSDKLNIQFDVSHIWEDRDFPWRLGTGGNQIWQEYWNSQPFFNASNPDGSLAYAGAGGSIGLNALTNIDHGGYSKNENQNLISSLALNYNLDSVLSGLKAKAFVNINQVNVFDKYWRYLPSSYTYNYSNDTYTQQTVQTNPDLVHTNSRSRNLTGQFSLNYNHTFKENHELSLLALYEVIDQRNEWISAGRGGFTSTSIDYLFNGGVGFQTSDGRAEEMGRQGFISRLNYGYKSKYLLEATLRIDQSAKFNADSRTGYFPSVSAGWRISEEGFLAKSTLINNLKVRVSYSETGQDNVGNFKYLSGYQAGNLYLVGSTPSAGLISTGLANPLLTWEKMTIYNAGLDFALFNNKFFGEFDVFWREREGIPGFRTSALPSTFGAVLPTENIHATNTRGFEVSLGYKGSRGDFSYAVTGNLTYARSKWQHFDEPDYEDPDQARISTLTGQWTDRTFGYVSEGLFTSQEEIDALGYVYNEAQGNASLAPGDVKYKDVNNDGILDWKDQVEIGKGDTPNWIGGLNFDLTYKGFDLSTFFQGGFGFTQNIVLRYGTNYSELMYNERWTPSTNDPGSLVPRIGGAPSNNWNSDFYQKDASYVRLKTLSLGYSFPKSLIDQLRIQKLRLYFSGTNIFTISKITKYDVDPEAPNNQSGYYYPQMQAFSLGLNLTF